MKLTKVNVIAMLTLLFVLSCTALGAVSIAKYVAEKDVNWDGEEDIDFTMDNVFEVTSEDELFAALNHGYPFIRLSQDIENPLIITDDPQNLYQDLILDLNGIEIQRNGHDPILNITPGVRLTVTDNSEEQTGGLYNPVGSVFNIAGGTITVVRGKFESGPRYSEYYSYNSEILDNSVGSMTKRTLVSGAQEVVYYKNNGTSFVKESGVIAPIIQSYPTEYNAIIYNHGNLYFDVPLSEIDSTSFTYPIYADTYCYYETSDDANYMSTIPDDADWYYTYYVRTEDNTYYSYAITEEEEASGLYTKVTIFGYEDVIFDAATKSNVESYYAVIKMQAGMGKLDIQDGKFYSYFGVDTTAAVNAIGGTITILNGEFSSRVPNAYTANSNSVLAREDYYLAFDDDNYFNNFKWANDTFTGGARARLGESYCILNSGTAQVVVKKGKFYSSNNNTISMNGGTLTASGIFTKNNTVALTDKSEKSPAVYMNSGTLAVCDASFNVYGDYNACVYINAGTISIDNSSCNIYGSNSYGIYSLVGGTGNFTVTNTDFNMSGLGSAGTEQVGIYAENGEVLLASTNNSKVNIAGTHSSAVYTAKGSTVKSLAYSYLLSGNTSEGIHSKGGKIEAVGGSIKLKEYSSAGIYSTGGEITVSGVSFTLEGYGSTGIYSTGGSIIAKDGCNITLTSNDSTYGIYAASADSDVKMSILIDGAVINVGDSTQNDKSGTVLASVGAFLSSANPDSLITLRNSQIYSNEIGIAVNGGDIACVGGGTLVAYNGSAVVVNGGNVRFGNDVSLSNVFTVQSTLNKDSGDGTKHAYDLQLHNITEGGASLVDYENNNGIYVSGGHFVCNAALELTFVGLENNVDYTYYTDEVIATYAIAVTGGNFTAISDTSKLKVTAKTGGGILVDGGNIKIGKSGEIDNSVSGDFVVLAQSLDYSGSYAKGDANYHTLTATSSTVSTWINWHNRYGGHALDVESGNLTVYSGYYESYYGNGLSVYNDGVVASEVNVHGGTFNGWMDGTYSGGTSFTSTAPYISGSRLCGPASYCGLSVIGNVDVNIYGGTFDGGNGGASISGRLSPGTSDCKTANVLLFAGVFGNHANPVSQDGICLYEGSNVIFGAHGADAYATADEYMSALEVNSIGCAIAYSPMSDYSDVKYRVAATASVYYGYYYAKNADTGIANQYMFNIYNANSSHSYFASNTSKGIYTNINNSLPLFYKWTGTSDSAQLAVNEDSSISYYAENEGYFTFDYEVVGTGSLTITYTNAIDGTLHTATMTAGTYTGAILRLAAGTSLTFTYNAGEDSTTSKDYFCKISDYGYELVAPDGYIQIGDYSGQGFTDSSMNVTDSGSSVTVDGTTYDTYTQYTGDSLIYDLYNTSFWGGTWGQGKLYSTHSASAAIPAMIKITANTDKVIYDAKLGIWNETVGYQVNDLTGLSMTVYRLEEDGTYTSEAATLSGSYESIGEITLERGDYILIEYVGASECKIDLQAIAYEGYRAQASISESFGTKS